MISPRPLDTSALARLNHIAGLAVRDAAKAQARFLELVKGDKARAELVPYWHLVEAVFERIQAAGGGKDAS